MQTGGTVGKCVITGRGEEEEEEEEEGERRKREEEAGPGRTSGRTERAAGQRRSQLFQLQRFKLFQL